eukprot:4043314-Prymnesium_polylepis.1
MRASFLPFLGFHSPLVIHAAYFESYLMRTAAMPACLACRSANMTALTSAVLLVDCPAPTNCS